MLLYLKIWDLGVILLWVSLTNPVLIQLENMGFKVELLTTLLLPSPEWQEAIIYSLLLEKAIETINYIGFRDIGQQLIKGPKFHLILMLRLILKGFYFRPSILSSILSKNVLF